MVCICEQKSLLTALFPSSFLAKKEGFFSPLITGAAVVFLLPQKRRWVQFAKTKEFLRKNKASLSWSF
jgi:hypothetical protein